MHDKLMHDAYDAANVMTACAISASVTHAMIRVISLCNARLKMGNKILLCGNGGSAAQCQHFAAELVGRLSHKSNRTPLAAIALTTDTSNLTALGNDFGFRYIFSDQVRALGQKGDILIGFSTSGSSQNVNEAMYWAKRMGIMTVGFTGATGDFGGDAETLVQVPSADAQHVQEAHLVLGHILATQIKKVQCGINHPD